MDRKGIRAGKKENKLGMRGSDTAELILEDCRVPARNVLGKVGYGFIDAMKVLDGGRISIAALARRASPAAPTRPPATTRSSASAFGKPIAEFQAIQFMLADMATEIEAARLLCYRAAAMKDAGEKITTCVGDGQALRLRGGGARHRKGRADLRRLRLHQGVSGREVLPRRQALHHRRRHERDPAHGHRPQAARRQEVDAVRPIVAMQSTTARIVGVRAGRTAALAQAISLGRSRARSGCR